MPYQSQSRSPTMVLVGDVMPTRRLSIFSEPPYLKLVELLRGADVTVANLETTVRERWEGTPEFTTGTPMTTPPGILQDLKWMGFDVVSTANNHATDYGVDGLLATARHLRAAGIPFAGSGASQGEAAEPAYVDTPAGRVGIVAANSRISHPSQRALDPRFDAPGRPGLNVLDFATQFTVPSDLFAALRQVSAELGLSQDLSRKRAMFYSESEVPSQSDDRMSFLGSTFLKGAASGTRTTVHDGDAQVNLEAIREARRQADWVVFSFHYHEMGDAGRHTAATYADMDEPAGFVVEFAKKAIDAGADVVAGHGPHLPLGIEIYRDRPILYSLGNFIFQNDTVQSVPEDAYRRFGLSTKARPGEFLEVRTRGDTKGFPATEAYWLSFAARVRFEAGCLAQVELVPVDLGFGAPRSQRGRPLVATGTSAARVLERVRDLSARYGTEIILEEGRGHVLL